MPKSAVVPVWSGPPALIPLLVPIAELKPLIDNPRHGDVGALAASLTRFGQYRTVSVRAGEIGAGNHLMRAAALLGWTHIAAVEWEGTYEEFRALALADNRLAELGTYDQDLLARMMQDTQDRVGLDGTGYDPDDLDDLLASLGRIPEVPRQEFKGGYITEVDPVAAERMAVAAGDRRAEAGGIVKHKDLIVMLPVDRFDVMAEKIRTLMDVWGVTTVAEAIERAVAAAYDIRGEL